jgi:hypothetical protein
MAAASMVLNQTVTIAQGAATAVSAAFGGTVSWAGAALGTGTAWAEGFPVTFQRGTVLVVDSASVSANPTGPQALYAAITAAGGTFRAWTANDSVGHAALGNLGGMP